MKNGHFRVNILDYEELGSTNVEMHRLLDEGDLEEGSIIRAEYQTTGKGHASNSWWSERGKNLLFSILMKPDFLAPDRSFHLSRITSLSILDTLEKLDIRAAIKWPNDILAGSGKIAGILIENSITGRIIEHSIIGIGLNVNQETFDPVIPGPSSVFLIKECHFDRERILDDFIAALDKWYLVLKAGKEEMIVRTYHDRLYGRDREALYSDGKDTFRARILRTLPGGELELMTDDGAVRRFGFKEIEHLG
jgi:BirA family biotin operon repressor/biotin-[acetyl-CoA-carboxylase] ligase